MPVPVDLGLLDPLTDDVALLIGDAAYLDAMVQVERALLGALADVGAATPGVEHALDAVAARLDLPAIAAASAHDGNPVLPLLAALRRVLPDEAADRLHYGATSQDVIDSAAMLVASAARLAVLQTLAITRAQLATLADQHRTTPMAGRTLGQHAAPTTFGLRMSVLLDGVTRAADRLAAVELPAQLGGSVGSLAVLVDALGIERTEALRRSFASRLGLAYRSGVWQVERSAVAELGAALAGLVVALGRIGLEVVQLTRTEIAEVALEQSGGGSSAMPQKHNPVPAVLLVAAARRAPGLAATLLAAGLALDDRPAGDWHAEWPALRELLRLALEAAAAARSTVGALHADPARMLRNLALSRGAVHAERAQRALAVFFGGRGAADLVAAALADEGDFVDALIESVERTPGVDPVEITARLREVTRLGGPIGLSQELIDDAVAAAEGDVR
ncbi:lyase family protein [uncultured Amnibacterium sp.]|uniref:lyase family protein n=1 Tax=uncultured Amnibacterium sp. TaxID=1631851 RepID=UPI0035CB8463